MRNFIIKIIVCRVELKVKFGKKEMLRLTSIVGRKCLSDNISKLC